MVNTGPLKKPNLAQRLLELHDGKHSGVLRFERGVAKKQLVIHQGNLSSAESNQPEDHLAQILVKMNRIARADLQKVSTLMKGGQSTEEALLVTAKVDREALEEGAREQAVSILGSLFSWEGCEIRFYPGEGRVKRQLNLQIPLPQLLILAVRRATANRQLPPSLNQVQGWVAHTDSGKAWSSKLPLDNVEAFAYSQAQQPSALENFLSLMPAGMGKPMDVVVTLILLGLIRVETPQTAAAPQSARARAAEMEDLARRVEDLLVRYEVANHYEILAVPTDASLEEIKAAYHNLAREFHPDRFQSQEYGAALRTQVDKLFSYINDAYTTLSDPTSRAVYDDKRVTKDSKLESTIQARATTDREKENMAESLYRAGRAGLSEHNFEKAVDHLKEAVYLRPDVARYHHFLGVAQMEIVRFRKAAEEHLQKAIELDSMNVDSHLALGKLYVKVNLPRRAEQQFQQVLQWMPSHPEATRLLEETSREKPGEKGLLGKFRRPFSR